MTGIEAVYILNLNGHIIFDYPVLSTPPSAQSLVPKILNLQGVYDSELSPLIEVSSSRVLYHEKIGNMVFLLPCSSTLPVLVPVEFVHRLVEVLEKYFSPPLISVKVENHYDIVSQIINEMLENGLPYVTEPDALQDLVPYGGILSKLLAGPAKSSAVSNIPWRRSNVRHSNNELFVDLIEKLDVVIPGTKVSSDSKWQSSAYYSSGGKGGPVKTSKPIINRAEGALFITSHLSGIPEIQLSLSLPSKIIVPAFHPCVDLGKWKEKPGTMLFIPPDGKTLVASYSVDISNQGIVFADLRIGLGVNKDEFEARVWTQMSREVKHVEGLVVNVVCDGSRVRTVQGLRVTAGDFHLNESGNGEWRFPGKTPLGWNASVRGVLVGNEGEDEERELLFPRYLTMSYTLSGQVPSGTKVQSLKIVSSRGMGEGVKPYKGVRYVTNGEITVR